MSQFTLERFIEPHRHELALTGRENEPSYADCAGCGALAPVIHGCIKSSDGRIAVLDAGAGWYRLAAFCQSCFGAWLERGLE